MNKLTTIVFFSLLLNSLGFTQTISGASAQQLYDLLKVSVDNVDGVKVKNFGLGWQCQEEMVMAEGSNFITYEYTCVLADPGLDGRIYLGKEMAQTLFEELGRRIGCSQILKTRGNANVMVRKLRAIECQERDLLAGVTEYRCSITP